MLSIPIRPYFIIRKAFSSIKVEDKQAITSFERLYLIMVIRRTNVLVLVANKPKLIIASYHRFVEIT